MLEMNGSGCVVDRQPFFFKRSYLKNGSIPCLIYPIWPFHNVSSSVIVPSHRNFRWTLAHPAQLRGVPSSRYCK